MSKGGNMKTKCDFCAKEFESSSSKVNWSNKQGWKQYCGDECRKQGKSKSEIKKCMSCGKDVKVFNSVIKKSKTGRFFCGHTCAAIENNKTRKISEETRNKMIKIANVKKEKLSIENDRLESLDDIIGTIFGLDKSEILNN
jgi:hypothetical protein